MTEIDYAPPLKWHRRPRVRRIWKGVLAVVAVVAFLALIRLVWVKGEVMLPQRACSNYSPPPTKVIYDEGPGAAGLLASGGEYVAVVGNMGPLLPPAAGAVPGCWRRLAAAMGTKTNGATIYLGRRRSPSGEEFVVAVQYAPPSMPMSFSSAFIESFNVHSVTVTPETLTQSAKATSWIPPLSVISTTPTVPPNVRIFAGQNDPSDASKFTIEYEMWGIRDVLDGRLDDQGWVRLEPRRMPEQPATPPATGPVRAP